jgi:O-antigen ligase
MPVLGKEEPRTRWSRTLARAREPQAGVFFWLSAFYVVYCARPEEWIPGILYVPLAKISGIFALLGLIMAFGRTKRGFRDLPREAFYFLAIIFFLLLAATFSPVWKGGAFFKLLDFSKALVVWVLTFFVVTNFERLRRIIFIQAGSVAIIALISVLKGRSHPRLEGVIGGIYSNPNDLAFAIVISLPFCFAFLLKSRSLLVKLFWGVAMLSMCSALFMTASRAGFIDIIVTGAVCLWIFAVKGKRPHLIVGALVVALVVGVAAGGRLKDRFLAINQANVNDSVDESAHDSYEQRRELMITSLKTIGRYPWGVGLGNFQIISGVWRDVHTSYLQIASEGGLLALVFYLLFFGRGFSNLRQLRRFPDLDPDMKLFAGALFATLVGFLVGSLFAPEAYQYFTYFAVAYTSVMLAMAKEKQRAEGPAPKVSHARWLKAPIKTSPVHGRAGDRAVRPSAAFRKVPKTSL